MNSHRAPAILSLIVLSGSLLFVPLAHSGLLIDPFALPKSVVLWCAAAMLIFMAAVESIVRITGRRIPPSAYVLSALLFGGALVATLRSANPNLSLRGLVELGALMVIAWGTSRVVRSPREASLLLRMALLGATVVAAGTLVQVFSPGYNLSVGGLSILPPAPAGATLGDPGLAAQFLLVGLPMAFGAVVVSKGITKIVCAIGVGLVLAALLFAGRPEGWLLAVFSLALVAGLAVARRWRLGPERSTDSEPSALPFRGALVAALVVLAVLGLSRVPALGHQGQGVLPLQHVSLLAPTTGDAVQDRAAATKGTLALLGRHPLGVGPAYWRHAFLEVAWTSVPASPFTLSHQAIHAGNSFLELAAEIGPAAALMFGGLLLLSLVRSGRAAFRNQGERGDLAAAVLGALVAALPVALYGSPLQEASPALLLWLLIGLAFSGAFDEDAVASQPDQGGWWRRPAGLATLLVLGAAVMFVGRAVAHRIDAARRTLAAQALLSSGDPRGAIQVLDHPSIRSAPDHLPHVLLANARLRSRAYAGAADEFTATIDRSPWFPAAYLGRASAREAQGLYDRADLDLQAALRIWPDNGDTLLSLGRLNARRGRLDQALENFLRVTQIDPALPDPWYEMGLAYSRRSQYDEAIGALRTCLDKNPRYPRANLSLGDAYEKRGLLDMAVGIYQRAAALDENDTEPRLKLANVFHKLGRYCDAKDSLAGARDLETDPARRVTIQGYIDTVDPLCRKEQQLKKP